MRLYVETMDAVVVDVGADGQVKLQGEDWSQPTLQERRAIIHAAQRGSRRARGAAGDPAGRAVKTAEISRR